ncbi:EboA domain-containing protein [Microbacterium sp. SLBN-146]|uniref:EboA domain-containing protein n=1 Tax=Microbacterium sp. SLBN-146 TaxID=2768457 RepID=UPI00114F3F9F|nr:EboA domain-containing protein [Microbacterium sp. SLBN-146]TQJ30794.1 sugar phosphate isomerase/epimerase [Microbacterium sp. SLBN-146]
MTTDAWVLGYGTNGFADHTLDDALDVIQGCGYRAVALTLGHPHLDPFADDWRTRTEELAADLRARGLRVVVETGTRYLLDPWHKHRPTLVDRDAEPRMAFLARAIEIAAVLDADCVSLWSGVVPDDDVDDDTAWTLLVERLAALVPIAEERGVTLSIEPEPGMLVETVSDALRLRDEVGAPASVGITVDLGHCVAVEPEGVVGALRQAGKLLRNVQVDDMKPGVHEHLELGTGDLDLVAAIETLREIGYTGVAAVELPRHSHDAPRLAGASIAAWDAAARAAMPARHPWTVEAVASVTADPTRAPRLFAEAGRAVGRDPLSPDDPHGYAGTTDDAARAALVEALHAGGADPSVVRALYEYGDNAERRGVLRGFDALADADLTPAWRETGLDLARDALRTNDPALVASAMGAFTARHLDDHGWRHGVLKLVFMGVPLSIVRGLDERRDAELAAMASRYAEERRAAGRSIPDDIRLIDTVPQE